VFKSDWRLGWSMALLGGRGGRMVRLEEGAGNETSSHLTPMTLTLPDGAPYK
jgi:hypothetical protein